MKYPILLILLIFMPVLSTGRNLLSDNDFLGNVPSRSVRLAGYTREGVEDYLLHGPVHRLEGLWMFTASDALVAVERFADAGDRAERMPRYRMVIVSSPRRTMVPGTVMGYMGVTSRKNVYDAMIYTVTEGATLTTPRRFTVRLGDNDTRLSFMPVKKGLAVSVRRLFPYLFRVGIREYDTRDESLDGCVRVGVNGVSAISEPRYL